MGTIGFESRTLLLRDSFGVFLLTPGGWEQYPVDRFCGPHRTPRKPRRAYGYRHRPRSGWFFRGSACGAAENRGRFPDQIARDGQEAADRGGEFPRSAILFGVFRVKRIAISDAKSIAEKAGADAVIVLAFGDGKYSATSYGRTKAICKEFGVVVDQIADEIERGTIQIPETK